MDLLQLALRCSLERRSDFCLLGLLRRLWDWARQVARLRCGLRILEVLAQGEVINAFEVGVGAPQVTGEATGTGLGKGIDEAFQRKSLEWDTVGVLVVGTDQFIL